MTTNIEWTDTVWNPVSGCTKVSQGCKHCYAERLWPKVEGARVKREGGLARAFTDVQTHPLRLNTLTYWQRPRRVFVNSMSDLFHEAVPNDFLKKVWDVMRRAPQHQFQILTKRPQRMHDWANRIGPLPNIWLGVSVEDQETVNERLPWLLGTMANVRFISYEPALGPVDLFSIDGPIDLQDGEPSPLHWVIAGGESGPDARSPQPAWFCSVRDQCVSSGVPFFFKQWGNWHPNPVFDGGVNETPMVRATKAKSGRILDGRTWDEYPSESAAARSVAGVGAA
jgi:protein gp37